MHIYLVRHTPYLNPHKVFAFHLSFHLSEEGRKQAGKVGQWFVKNQLTGLPISTSPVLRCVQTAEIIAAATGSFVAADERLIETRCPGLQGTLTPADNEWVLEEEHPSRESRAAILKRMLHILEEKIAEEKDCVFVSHGDELTILYYHLNQKTLPKYLWNPNNEPNTIRRGEIVDITVSNNSVVSAKRVKDTPHE